MRDYVLRYQVSPEYVRTTRLNKTCSSFSIADLTDSFCSLKLITNRLLKLSVEVITLLVIAYSSNVKVEEDEKNPSKIQLMGFLVFPLVLCNYFGCYLCMLTLFCSLK